MKLLVALFALPGLAALALSAQAPDWNEVRTRAEELYTKGSFELARREYARVDASKLGDAEKRWLEFRLADAGWRALSGAERADDTEIERARKDLEALVAKAEHPEDKDRTWALAEESLGDFHWVRRNVRDFSGALPRYQAALDWWAGARDVETARQRYLAIAFRMGWPDGGKGDSGWWMGQVPLEVAEGAVKIAQDPRDKAQAQFLYATCVYQRGRDFDEVARGIEALRAVIAQGKSTRFYDDALFHLAQQLEQNGAPKVAEDGSWTREPDCVEALALYRRITAEFKKGDSAFVDQANEAIKRILRTEVNVSVPSVFLPGSEVSCALGWRNAARVDLMLYAVDLTHAVDLHRDGATSGWLESIDVKRLDPRLSWSYDTKDDGRHRPGSTELKLPLKPEEKLEPGAYVLEARAGDAHARELVLVSQTALVVKTVGSQVVAWCCDALTSEPVPGADVHLFERSYDGSRWNWSDATKKSGDDGLAVFDLAPARAGREIFVCARRAERQAFAGGGSEAGQAQRDGWRIYAFTDRSAYRPGDTVEWKVTARTRDGGAYATPAGKKLAYEIRDPRNQVLKKGELVLNAFGSGWANLALDATQPLGQYQVQFQHAGSGVGGATLFRLEEYKLPEYEVSVKTAEKDGQRKLFVVGDKVEVDVEADYFSGGAVANADVEVVVRQSPYYRRWITPRDYPWFYEDESERWNRDSEGQVVKQEHVKTDAAGHARISFDTPRNLGQDFEYQIEARVTDASRREVRGNGRVRVTRREYDVSVTSAKNLHRPGERAEFDVRATDANDAPVAAEGVVTITRERWVEAWIDPTGRVVEGAELDELRARDLDFALPPRPGSGGLAWRRKSAEYVAEQVARENLKLDAKGQSRVGFTPAKTGYYRAHWTSKDGRGRPVEGETFTWVVKEDARDLGYRADGLEIVVDKDTFVAGERAPVMIATPISNRWVLFSVEAEKIHSWQVVHVEGQCKLVQIALTEEHVPNVFLSAVSTLSGMQIADSKAVVVPPVRQFLSVDVKSDRDPVLPGSKGTLDVLVKDVDGEPVSAEVALSLVDESVAAIQSDYALDPRQFFYGEKRGWRVRTHTSFDQRRYARYVLDDKGRVVDERQARAETERDAGDAWGEPRRSAGEFAVGIGGRKDQSHFAGRSAAKKVGNYRGPSDSAAQSAPAAEGAMADERLMKSEEKNAVQLGLEGGDVQVRSDFRETALWLPDVVTDASGRAHVEVQYPDSLTRWKATARAAGNDARFGSGARTVRANKPLAARLEAPRFFTVGDEVVVSGVIDNRTDEPLSVHVALTVEGPLSLSSRDMPDVTIAAQGEVRVDWKSRAAAPGDVKITLSARSSGGPDAPADAMQKTFFIQDHGLEVQVARALKLENGELVFTLDVPAAREHATTAFTIDVSPSLAVTMLDALPYLVDYPYGCTEQTMSRFLPAAIVAHTLSARGLSAEAAMSRVFGGIEQETAGKTHPKGKRSLDELDRVTRAALERLYDFQHGDGGWGWWKEGESDAWMSAYVVWGLSLARDAGLDVRGDAIERGSRFLTLAIVKAEREPDLAAWMLHALAAGKVAQKDEHAKIAFDKLWEQKDALGAYGRALFTLAAHGFGREDAARQLAESLANGAQIDEHTDVSRIGQAGQAAHAAALKTAHWGVETGWWRWHQGAVESTAFALRALSAVDPQNPLVAQAANWLVQNRRGAQWSSTRDTAIAVLGLDAFLGASGEVARDVSYEVVVNGETLATRTLAADDMLRAAARFTLPAASVKDGANEIRVRRTRGEGPLYVAARAVFFSREEPIPAHGSDIFVKRQFWKLVPRETLLKGFVYDRMPLADGQSVRSGERVEIVLTLESKNDFEYLMFEDNKAAGLEAVELKSGGPCAAREIKSGAIERRFPGGQAIANAPDENDWARFTGRQCGVHQELRDRKVALFLDKLPQGIWEVRYELRAEVPGTFHALPTVGQAMYVPEIRCNGDEQRVVVLDRPEGL